MESKRKKSIKGIDYLSRNQVVQEYLRVKEENYGSYETQLVEEAS